MDNAAKHTAALPACAVLAIASAKAKEQENLADLLEWLGPVTLTDKEKAAFDREFFGAA